MNTRRDRYPTILATLAVAALLMLLPLPNWLQAAWPYWMALTLIYWCLETQGRIKVTIVKPTGVPGTGLGYGVVNQGAIVGILGHNAPRYLQMMQAHAAGELPPEHADVDSVEYYALEPEYLADQIVYAINQPWGVSIGDITVRATGDAYIL